MIEVHLTVDTECSMGGAWEVEQYQPVPPERAILGKIGSKYFGTPLITEILERYELRATFFLEVFAAQVFNDSQLVDAYRELARSGHDLQLHLHPVYHYYHLFIQGEISRDRLPPRMDLIGSHSLDTQIELLKKGSSLFHSLVGRCATAFRAGCFGASNSTLAALSRIEILYDSSFNASFLGSSCLMDAGRPANTPWQEHGVWEVPVTNFETGSWKFRGLKPLDIAAVSFLEMKRVLEQCERLGTGPTVFLLHSFTLFKKADVQFTQLRPDYLVIRRFHKLCKFLKENSDRFKVVTFADRGHLNDSPGSPRVPRLGSFLPAGRKIVQGVNRIPWI